jgi:hypothetical protein
MPEYLVAIAEGTADDVVPARRLRHHWTLALVTDGLRLALHRLEAGEELNQRTL